MGLSLLGGLNQLILFSTFNLAFVYLVTCAAVLALRERGRIRTGRTVIEKMTGPTLPVAGILLSALLIFESGVTTVIFRAHNNCNRIRRDKFVGTAKRGIRHITNEYALKKSL